MLPTPAIRRWSSKNDLTGALRPRAIRRRCSAVNSGVNGSTPSLLRQVRVARDRAEQEMAGAEATGIVVHETMAVVELEPDPRVWRLELRVEQQRARHPQVNQEVTVARQRPHEVLAGAAHALDHGTAQLRFDRPRGQRAGPARIEDLGADDRAPLEMGRQLTADRLDLG